MTDYLSDIINKLRCKMNVPTYHMHKQATKRLMIISTCSLLIIDFSTYRLAVLKLYFFTLSLRLHLFGSDFTLLLYCLETRETRSIYKYKCLRGFNDVLDCQVKCKCFHIYSHALRVKDL